MAGSTDAHVTLTGNLFAALLSHTRGSECRVYFSDMKAQIEALNRYYYPDIMVTCDSEDKNESTFKRYPILIIEVLSDSTAGFDRGDKFADYQTRAPTRIRTHKYPSPASKVFQTQSKRTMGTAILCTIRNPV